MANSGFDINRSNSSPVAALSSWTALCPPTKVDSLFPIRETALNVISSLRSYLADDARGNPDRQRKGRNIFGHNRASADDAPSSNANAGKNDCASAQPAILFDRHRQLDPLVAGGNSFRMRN
jgi:hypothetical protein